MTRRVAACRAKFNAYGIKSRGKQSRFAVCGAGFVWISSLPLAFDGWARRYPKAARSNGYAEAPNIALRPSIRLGRWRVSPSAVRKLSDH